MEGNNKFLLISELLVLRVLVRNEVVGYLKEEEVSGIQISASIACRLELADCPFLVTLLSG